MSTDPGQFTMDEGWLEFHPRPSKPAFSLPEGAIDSHCHVFGPGHHFPYAAGRSYTPCDASCSQLTDMHEHIGVSRRVIVQGMCHGVDNSALIDALLKCGDSARGVVTVRPDVTDVELRRFNDAGVRGIRFNFIERHVDVMPTELLDAMAARIADMGWHLTLSFTSEHLEHLVPIIERQPCSIIIDHMGLPDVSLDPEEPAFSRFMDLLDKNPHVHTTISCPERVSMRVPTAGNALDYQRVLPFSRALAHHFPDRVLWGTDWPHPGLSTHMPNDGDLVDLIPQIADSALAQRKLLIDNPTRLYWNP